MTVVSVRHEFVDGWHSFTSQDVPGLWICGPDEQFAELYGDIGLAIEALNEARGKPPIRVRPEIIAEDASALSLLRDRRELRFLVEDDSGPT